MNLLIFATFILFTSILSIVIRRHNRSDKKHQEQFWEREARANHVRRKSLDNLAYISLPLESLPTQAMADMLHIIHQFGGVENLKGKKLAMTWAYSPSYGKPLSVPQGVIGLMTRFGMDVVLAHPEGYDVMPEGEEIAKKNADATGGSYKKVATMEEAFQDADIVYPKSWAPFAAMEERTKLYQAGDQAGIDALEKKLLAQNAQHKDWTCSEEMMKKTRNGSALYLHCLPADITGLSCPEGEVDNSVFDRYLVPLYKEASYKPYVIAAMIMMSKVKDPVSALMALDAAGKRKFF